MLFRSHGVREELCSETPPAAPLPKEEDPSPDAKDGPPNEDPLVYVPHEIKIPLGKDGQPGPWCMYHRSDKHNIEDCRRFNDTKKRQKSEECYTCGEPGHINRDCALTKKPKKAKPATPPKGRPLRTFTSASTQTEDFGDSCSSLTVQWTQEILRMTAASWDQTFICENLPGEE